MDLIWILRGPSLHDDCHKLFPSNDWCSSHSHYDSLCVKRSGSFLTQSSQHVVTISKTVGTLIFERTNQHQSVKVLFEATFTKGQSYNNLPGQVKGCSGSVSIHPSIQTLESMGGDNFGSLCQSTNSTEQASRVNLKWLHKILKWFIIGLKHRQIKRKIN